MQSVKLSETKQDFLFTLFIARLLKHHCHLWPFKNNPPYWKAIKSAFSHGRTILDLGAPMHSRARSATLPSGIRRLFVLDGERVRSRPRKPMSRAKIKLCSAGIRLLGLQGLLQPWIWRTLPFHSLRTRKTPATASAQLSE